MITLQNLSFGYTPKEPLFSNINLSLKNGEICGLLGKNGSGKTSLLKLIAGLIFPYHGKAHAMGHNPSMRDPVWLENIYFLPESFSLPDITIHQYISYYAEFYKKFDHALFQSSLAECHVAPVARLSQLSFGQQKKCLIAFGLATQANLLILDEPTNGLDIPSKIQFKKCLAAHIAEDRLIMISTHQVHDIEHMVDSIVILDEGKIVLHQQMADTSKNIETLFSETVS